MIFLIVGSAVALAVWFGWGLLVRSLLVRAGFDASSTTSLDAVLIPGAAAMTGVGAWGSLALPLGRGALVALCLPLLLLATRALRTPVSADLGRLRTWLASWPASLWIVLAVFTTLVLWKATGSAIVFDSGLYHLQAIRWIETYRVVPGLANLHSRLGFNNHWFITAALLQLPWPGGPVHAVNTALYLVMVVWGCDGVARLFRRQAGLATLWQIAALMFLVEVPGRDLHSMPMLELLSSPSPDTPSIVLSWWVLGVCLSRFEERSRPFDLDLLLIVLVAAYSITVKLAAAPQMFAVLAALAAARFWSRRGLLAIGATGVFVGVPWIVRNWVLTGWPLYPTTLVRFGTPDWAAPVYELRLQVATITAWARQPVTYYDTVLHMKTEEWARPWFEARVPFDKLLLTMTLVSAVLLAAAWLVGRLRPRGWSGETGEAAVPAALFWFLSFAGTVYWVWTAPDPRFGLGFIFPAACAGCLPWARPLVKRGGRRFALLLLLALGVHGVRYDYDWEATSRWIRPVPFPVEGNLPTWTMRDLNMPISVSDQCWDRALPCTCTGCFNPRWQARGASLADGFRLVGKGPARDEHDPYFSRPIPAEYLR